MSEIHENKTSRNVKQRIKNKKRIWLWIVISIIVFVIGFGAYTFAKIDAFLGNITTDTEPVPEGEQPPDPKFTGDPFAMVVLGIDSRDNLGTLNTDVIMVAVVDPETKKVTMLSLPRDTAVKIPGESGYHKVNSAYAYGELEKRRAERKKEPITVTGTSKVKKTIEGLLGIPVQHYVLIDFEGFEAVINELGGVEIDVKKRMLYNDPTDGTHINLQPGLQVLKGKEALDYVRHRKDDRGSKYYSSDFDRNERQQEVVRAIVDKMKTVKGVTSIFKVMDAADDHIRTDFSKEQIKGLALTFKSFSTEQLISLKVEAYWDSGLSLTLLKQQSLEEVRQSLWAAMGIPEEEGRALINAENDIKPKPKPKPEPKPEPEPEEPASPEETEDPGTDSEPTDLESGDGVESPGNDSTIPDGAEEPGNFPGRPSEEGNGNPEDQPNIGSPDEGTGGSRNQGSDGSIPGEIPFPVPDPDPTGTQN